MKLIFLIITFLNSYAALAVEEVPVISRLELVGVIVDQNDPLKKSVLVIRDRRLQKTYTILAKDTIPNTEYEVKSIARNHIIVGEGDQVVQINQKEREDDSSIGETNVLDSLDSDAVISKSNLAWEKLEERAKKQNLEIFRKSKKTVKVGEDEESSEDSDDDFEEDDGQESVEDDYREY